MGVCARPGRARLADASFPDTHAHLVLGEHLCELDVGLRRESRSGTDVTWQRDLEYFERLAATGETSLENDWWISRAIQQAVLSA